MAYASRSGRARTSARAPRAFGVCQRCGIWYNRDQLNFQWDWRGTTIANLYLLVCKHCTDKPNEQLRAVALPADPTPVYYPVPENFAAAETDYRATAEITIDPVTGLPIPSTTLRVTQDSQNRITKPTGAPAGLSQNAVMPYNGATQQAFGAPLALLSVVSTGSGLVSVTCYQAHGLITGAQISVDGLINKQANGFYSVTVVSPMAFTYEPGAFMAAQALLQGGSRMITALIGIPPGSTTIPQTSA